MRKIVKHIIGNLFPPKCLSCDNETEKQGLYCHDCWKQLEIIGNVKCNICSVPLSYQTELCEECINHLPAYNSVHAPYIYNDIMKTAISRFKYHDITAHSEHYARAIYRSVYNIIDEVDIITPVPLHLLRYLWRKYNQAHLLASQLSKISRVEYSADIIKRVKYTAPQARLDKKARQRNVEQAFRVQKNVTGKNILLIDDVMTTGSTVNQCAKLLKLAGAKKVFVGVLARRPKSP